MVLRLKMDAEVAISGSRTAVILTFPVQRQASTDIGIPINLAIAADKFRINTSSLVGNGVSRASADVDPIRQLSLIHI